MLARPVWFDGRLVPFEQATVSALSHAVHRGSQVFDVGTFHRAPGGPALFRMREHVERLLRSAALVGQSIPHDRDALEEATREVVRASGLDEGLVRWAALWPEMEADLVPRASAVRVAIAAYARGDLPSRPKPAAMRIAVFDDVRKAGPEVMPPQAKVAAAYLGPMIARRRALEAGFDEVVLLDREGLVGEAPTANVFAVLGGALVTPPARLVLGGITRDSVIAIARDEGIEVREEPFPLATLEGADEAFLTASSLPLAPVVGVNERRIGAGPPGPITERLKARLIAAQSGRDARFASWLSPVG